MEVTPGLAPLEILAVFTPLGVLVSPLIAPLLPFILLARFLF